MKPIPAALQEKLKSRFKADSTGTLPCLRLVASQASYNTLLTEPIHQDIAPALGDVALRQMEGEQDISKAYAVCLDNGYAQIYERELPALHDNPWKPLWALGRAEDVAIEFHGQWVMNAGRAWYYLQTDEFPYIFFTQEGRLYVQYWNDSSTRTFLAEGVSQLSACKGWQSTSQSELDQGLIIGYLKDGAVYYRAYCCQNDGSYIWEPERCVESLGNTNTTLSVIRTNDFRVGFLTESGGGMHLVLSSRNYAGLSIRPETVHAYPKVSFQVVGIADRFGYLNETVTAKATLPFFAFETPEAAEADTVRLVRAERINRDDVFFSYGFRLYFDRPLMVPDAQELTRAVTLKITGDTRAVTAAEYSPVDCSVCVYIDRDIKRTVPLTLSVESKRTIWFFKDREVKWYLPAFSVDIPAELNVCSGFTREGVTLQHDANMYQEFPEFYCTQQNQSLTTVCTTSIELVPIRDMPL